MLLNGCVRSARTRRGQTGRQNAVLGPGEFEKAGTKTKWQISRNYEDMWNAFGRKERSQQARLLPTGHPPHHPSQGGLARK